MHRAQGKYKDRGEILHVPVLSSMHIDIMMHKYFEVQFHLSVGAQFTRQSDRQAL